MSSHKMTRMCSDTYYNPGRTRDYDILTLFRQDLKHLRRISSLIMLPFDGTISHLEHAMLRSQRLCSLYILFYYHLLNRSRSHANLYVNARLTLDLDYLIMKTEQSADIKDYPTTEEFTNADAFVYNILMGKAHFTGYYEQQYPANHLMVNETQGKSRALVELRKTYSMHAKQQAQVSCLNNDDASTASMLNVECHATLTSFVSNRCHTDIADARVITSLYGSVEQARRLESFLAFNHPTLDKTRHDVSALSVAQRTNDTRRTDQLDRRKEEICYCVSQQRDNITGETSTNFSPLCKCAHKFGSRGHDPLSIGELCDWVADADRVFHLQ